MSTEEQERTTDLFELLDQLIEEPEAFDLDLLNALLEGKDTDCPRAEKMLDAMWTFVDDKAFDLSLNDD